MRAKLWSALSLPLFLVFLASILVSCGSDVPALSDTSGSATLPGVTDETVSAPVAYNTSGYVNGGTTGFVTGPTVTVGGVSVVSVAPSSALTVGGKALSISGSGFGTSALVSLGAENCAVTAMTATQITCTTPPGQAGPVTLTVTTAGQSVAYPYSYSLPIPQGWFVTGQTGEWSDGLGNYCSYQSWGQWLAAGAPEGGASAVPNYAGIPDFMTYGGVCGVPEGFFWDGNSGYDWSDGQGHYCTYPSEAAWIDAGSPGTTGTVAYVPIPASMTITGACGAADSEAYNLFQPGTASFQAGSVTEVFAIRNDGYLIQEFYDPNAEKWNEGVLSATGSAPHQFQPGGIATLQIGNTTEVFVIRSDGYLTQFFYDSNANRWNEGILAATGGTAHQFQAGAVAALQVGGVTEVFAIRSDGYLTQFFWNPNTSQWSEGILSATGGTAHQFLPGGIAVLQAGGVTEVFAIRSDGYLTQFFWNPNTSQWSEGVLSATGGTAHQFLPGGLAALQVGDATSVFAVRSDSYLTQLIWNPDTSQWAEGALSQTQYQPGIAAFQAGSATEVFAVRADGYLGQLFWDSSTQAWNEGILSNGSVEHQFKPGVSAFQVGNVTEVFGIRIDGNITQFFYDPTANQWNEGILPE